MDNWFEIEVEISAVKTLMVKADDAITAEDTADEIIQTTTIQIKPTDDITYFINKVTKVPAKL